MESFDPHDTSFYWKWRNKTPGIPNVGKLECWADDATLEELKAAREAALPYLAYIKLRGILNGNPFGGFIETINDTIIRRFPDHE